MKTHIEQTLTVFLFTIFGCQPTPPLAPISVDLIVDASPGSGIDLRSVQEDLSVLLPALAERPGSVLRVTGLPQDPSDLRVLGEVRSTTASRPAKRTVMAHERRFDAESTERLVPAISAYFSEARLTRSPIAESLGRALLATVPAGTRRILVVATDGAEESDLGRFEAPRPLPTAEAFLHRLENAGIFLPSSACGTLIVFTHFQPRQGNAALRRYDSIKALWTAAITRAGGHVFFTTGSITSDTLNQ
jgi:hypothetical protein